MTTPGAAGKQQGPSAQGADRRINMDNNLTSMTFTLTADKPVSNRHNVCPGSYVLNGTRFDFRKTEYKVLENGKQIQFSVFDFDDQYSDRPLTKKDIGKGKSFAEFYVFTGETCEEDDDDDEKVEIEAVSDLRFGFSDGTTVKASRGVLQSANLALAS